MWKEMQEDIFENQVFTLLLPKLHDCQRSFSKIGAENKINCVLLCHFK